MKATSGVGSMGGQPFGRVDFGGRDGLIVGDVNPTLPALFVDIGFDLIS